MDIDCPDCGIPLNAAQLAGTNVDVCPTCDGTWYDAGELMSVLEQSSVSASKPKLGPPDREALETSPGGACPHCRLKLDAVNYAYDSGVTIRKCGKCQGGWLAAGQLEAIAAYKKGRASVNRLADAMSEEIEQANDEGPVVRLLRSRWISGAFALAYLSVMLNRRGLIALRGTPYLFLALACIWFPEIMAHFQMRGSRTPRMGESATPEIIMVVVGWLILLAPLVIVLLQWF